MIRTAHFSGAGPRKHNEDRVLDLVNESYALIGVADGLGGYLGGSVAAEAVLNEFEPLGQFDSSQLAEAIERAHGNILKKQNEDDELRGMGTTATFAHLTAERLQGVHVGDTRCVLQRANGIQKLTTEHTEARRLLDAGRISKEEFLNYPRRNILDNAVGKKSGFYVEAFSHDLISGDKIVITSDGVHEKIRLRELLPLIMRNSDPDDIVKSIVAELEIRRPDDNYSIVAAVVA